MTKRYHIWISNHHGFMISMDGEKPPIAKPVDRLKYMGFTTDHGWPKTMNTGRVLYVPNKKWMERNRRLKKR